MAVYQTYIGSMNQFAQSNPFQFKHIEYLNSIDNFHDVGPSVVMASPGDLQSGLSRQLFDKWCTDKKNACVIPGYAVEGTLAKAILNDPREVTLANGLPAPLHMQVHYISFSAHADFPQTSAFLDELRPPNIILVHGEANEMSRLKQRLIDQFEGTNTNIISPKNCQSIEMYFRSEKIAKTIGRLAERVSEAGGSPSGLLVKKGFTYQIMDPEDLRVYTQLSTANITQRMAIPYCGSFEVIRYRLKQIYESVKPSTKESDVPALIVHERVTVSLDSENYVTLQWSSDPISDMVSDSVVSMILNIGREGPNVVPVEVVVKTKEDRERIAHKVVHALMVSLFGDVRVADEGKFVISVDADVAYLDGRSGDVECENIVLKERIRTAFRRIQGAVRPIPLAAS
uniref:Pre-mRNA 3'-end-processing endonuclease polyadenylation factor C-term domain-containing protein n=1 Tax=Arundo donax TaxID=35708 RepID=A0A0A8YEE2_ARUDO